MDQHSLSIIGGGAIGGKARGFVEARAMLTSAAMRVAEPEMTRVVRFPESFFIGTAVFDEFVAANGLQPVIERCTYCHEEEDFAHLRQRFLDATLPKVLVQTLSRLIEHLAYPLAVRSSSILEDRAGTSFAGKYETVFIANRGTLTERLQQLIEAIKRVYASTFNPGALEYRSRHKLIETPEKMAILLQEAIGREFEGYFLPLMAGVGFSQNGYCWNRDIKKEDGIVRLVFGLGTRAVGRGYARIVSPGKPMARPEGNAAATIDKFSQGTIDALNLAENRIDSFHFTRVVRSGIDCYPRAEGLVSLRDGEHLYMPPTRLWPPEHKPVLTFDAALSKPWCGLSLVPTIATVMKRLEKGFSHPIDIEFAVRVDDAADEAHFYLLQARPLSQREAMKPRPIPTDIPDEDKILYLTRSIPSGRVRNIEYLVFVDPHRYHEWALTARHEVARAIGRVNRALAGKTFILMGPGRWGSANIALGVPTKYAEIANAAMLIEIAMMREGYVPEVSYGTHFFQDLIEDGIVYAPLYPGEEGVIYREDFLRGQASVLPDLLPEPYYRIFDDLIRVIHLPSVTGGRLATAVLNGETDEGLIYLKK